MKKNTLLLFITLTFTLQMFAQPVNDDCANATPYINDFTMFTEGNCTGTSNMLDLLGATNDIGSDNPSCDGVSNFGVWYTWTATSTGLTFTSGNGHPGLAVYEAGTCSTLVEVGCLNNASGTIEDLIVSNDYMIYIWDDTSDGLISFCLEELTSIPIPPANNDCADAITVSVGIESCGTNVTGTNQFATDSGVTQATCATGIYNGGDIWYTFTMPVGETELALTISASDFSGTQVELYGDTCGALTQIDCANSVNGFFAGLNKLFTGLTPSATYFLRIYDRDNNNIGDVTFCLGTPPANDDCANPTPYTNDFTMFTEGNCAGLPNMIDLSSATSDIGDDNPSCNLSSIFGVWYTWTATSTGLTFTSGTGNPGLAIYEAGACGTLVEVGCLNNISGVISDLTINSNYIIYLWDDTFGTVVDFCLEEFTPPPLANDDCANATPYINDFTMFTEGNCTGTPNTLDLLTATDDIGNDDPSCDTFSPNIGVWYTWTATSAGLTFTSGNGNPGLAVYEEGTCGALVEVGCLNNISGAITGLTISNNYYIYLWDDTAGTMIDFCLEEFTPPPPPVNDDCANATPYINDFTMFTEGNCTGTSNTLNLLGASNDTGSDTPSCGSLSNFGVWYTWTATSTGLTFTTGANFPGFAIYEAGTCGSLVEIKCLNDSGTINGLTINNNYIIYIWHNYPDTMVSFCLEESTTPLPPANDDCENAISLTVNPDLTCGTVTAGTTVGATTSTQVDDVTGTPNTDVWFSFVATGTEHTIRIQNVVSQGGTTTTNTDMAMGVYDGSGTCTGLVFFDDSFPNTLNLTGLTATTTYYVRVYGWHTIIQYINFDICVGTPLPPPLPPANDDCENAISLTVNPNLTCGTVTAGTTVGATASTQVDDVIGTPNTDVWFSFVATGTDHTIRIQNVVNQGGTTTTNTDMAMGIYDATGTCTGLVFFDDSDPNTLNLTGLTATTTYYVRVYGRLSSIQYNNFDICVGTPPPPLTNDDCVSAIPYINEFTMLEEGNCSGTPNMLDLSLATDDIGNNPSCDISGNFGVWYTWVATSTGLTFTSGTNSPGLAVYEAGNCGALVEVGCLNNVSGNIEGLTINNDYILYIWSDTANNIVDFCLEEYTSLSPPANDNCSGAIVLTPGALFSDNSIDGTVVNATVGSETASCGNNGPGVWYSIVVPTGGNITIETGPDTATGNTGFDSVIEVFSGSCGALVSIDCDDNGAATGSFSMLNLTGLTPNSTIFVRVWEFGGNAVEPFAISAYNTTLGLENTTIEKFEYFPNPTNNSLTLKAQNSIQKVNVYNMLGQEVMKIMPNNLSVNIDMSNLSQGPYFVKITINNVTKTIRVIKM